MQCAHGNKFELMAKCGNVRQVEAAVAISWMTTASDVSCDDVLKAKQFRPRRFPMDAPWVKIQTAQIILELSVGLCVVR